MPKLTNSGPRNRKYGFQSPEQAHYTDNNAVMFKLFVILCRRRSALWAIYAPGYSGILGSHSHWVGSKKVACGRENDKLLYK